MASTDSSDIAHASTGKHEDSKTERTMLYEDAAKMVASAEATAALLERESRVYATLSGQSASQLAQLKEMEDQIKVVRSRTEGLIASIRQTRGKAQLTKEVNAQLRKQVQEGIDYVNARGVDSSTVNLRLQDSVDVLSEAELESRLGAILSHSQTIKRRTYTELHALNPGQPASSKSSGQLEKAKSFHGGSPKTNHKALQSIRGSEGSSLPGTPLGRTKSSRILLEHSSEADLKKTVSQEAIKLIEEEVETLESSLHRLRGSSEAWHVYSTTVQASLAAATREYNIASQREESLVPLLNAMQSLLSQAEEEHSSLEQSLHALKPLMAVAADKEWDTVLEKKEPAPSSSSLPAVAPAAIAVGSMANNASNGAAADVQDTTSVKSVVSDTPPPDTVEADASPAASLSTPIAPQQTSVEQENVQTSPAPDTSNVASVITVDNGGNTTIQTVEGGGSVAPVVAEMPSQDPAPPAPTTTDKTNDAVEKPPVESVSEQPQASTVAEAPVKASEISEAQPTTAPTQAAVQAPVPPSQTAATPQQRTPVLSPSGAAMSEQASEDEMAARLARGAKGPATPQVPSETHQMQPTMIVHSQNSLLQQPGETPMAAAAQTAPAANNRCCACAIQ